MDFDSPDVMKDFPGLYASELNKQCNNDSDYSDDNEKVMKKDILIGKRKEKKDKDKGYAALEGESSADENFKSRSPSKTKKAKSFKFSTKTKEKRDKSREKEKDVDKKKDRDKKNDKKLDKEKLKSEKTKKLKQSLDESADIGDILPIFGATLEVAVERSRCHDGVDIPLPIRECIDYIESIGVSFEGIYKEKCNKMNKQSLAAALNHTFHCSSRLLHALLHHCPALFPSIRIERYIPPLESGAKLPDNPEEIDHELKKQESLLTQIHKEMNVGCISKQREELLWEVQRIITQLKRKLKCANKDKEAVVEKNESLHEEKEEAKKLTTETGDQSQDTPDHSDIQEIKQNLSIVPESQHEDLSRVEKSVDINEECSKNDDGASEYSVLDNNLALLQLKNEGLHLLRDSLLKDIQTERNQIMLLKSHISTDTPPTMMVPSENLDEVMDLFLKENQILQIKKINLVRQIIEEQEMCIELKAQIQSHRL
ncbi:hypothetical protein BDFB_000403 [Asbolus verrucosus]|uniref:RalA-binding protein 1-like Ral binding domain-containing protein n=1 Tax=Asbolus verrucosus TaxID=1661398 RepID=A0A482VPW3_ASBVE|nr:hypothetical protein BDFB_000403 [Asbolus verrucosus]